MGFVIKTTHLLKLTSILEGLNDQVMKVQLPLGHKFNATLISAYAPMMTNPDEIKDKFYEELDSLFSSIPQSEKLIQCPRWHRPPSLAERHWETPSWQM